MYRRLFYLLLVFVFVSSACSFGTPAAAPTPTEKPQVEPVSATATPKPTEVVEPTAVPTKAGPLPVDNVEGVKSAVIQVVAEGTFVNPDFTVDYNAAGAGSGFIIDPSGIAVTNNHVVTGAAMLQVYVGGSDKPVHAKVLGVSECSDLAVIKLDGGNYPFLTFSEDPAKVGADVYLAGFPLGDPEYTLKKGIISKAKTIGNFAWASIENTIEHDALGKPGNSGGPLVNDKGQVVGIHFGSYSGGSGPFFAISPLEVKNVIEDLRSGKDVNSLGINGEAFVAEDNSWSGIWVSSVKSGSPADKAGIRAGDIVTKLENIVLATDGTMADYCNILRSHKPTDTLAVSVLRYADGTFLSGQINGDKLAVTDTFTTIVDDSQVTPEAGATDYSGYVTVTDDSNSFSTEIPAEWTEINGSRWEVTWSTVSGSAQVSAPAISAAANLDNFNTTWDESGVFMTASSDLGRTGGYIELLDSWRDYREYTKYCDLSETDDFGNSKYEGKYQLWKNCSSNGSLVMTVVARPVANPTAYLVLIEIVITKDADLAALDHIIGMFDVYGDV